MRRNLPETQAKKCGCNIINAALFVYILVIKVYWYFLLYLRALFVKRLPPCKTRFKAIGKISIEPQEEKGAVLVYVL